MTTPHRRTMVEMNNRGPTFRMIAVAGIWKTVYVMKKTRDEMLYALFFSFIFRSVCMLWSVSLHLLVDLGHLPCDRSSSHIGAIQQTDTVKKAASDDKADVNSSNQFLFGFWGHGDCDILPVRSHLLHVFAPRGVNFFLVFHLGGSMSSRFGSGEPKVKGCYCNE